MQIADCRLAIVGAVGLMVAMTPPAMGQQPRDSLQGRVMMRFLQNYRQSAELDDDQVAQLREALRQSFEGRAEVRQRERRLLVALDGQLKPGVAANRDSLTRLLDGLVEVQQQQVELARQEQARFAEFLSPVQRAILTMHFRRFQQQIERVRRPMRTPPGMRRR